MDSERHPNGLGPTTGKAISNTLIYIQTGEGIS